MRQLNISKQPTDPNWAADRAQALPLLQKLAAAHPLVLSAEVEAKLLRFLVALATQYRGRGAGWEALLQAGYAAVSERAADFEKDADYALARSSFWLRSALAKLLPNSALGEDGEVYFLE